MDSIETTYGAIKSQIADAAQAAALAHAPPQLIAVSKRQPEARVDALLAAGHRLFGENHVQEAAARWEPRRAQYEDLSLHLIGALQSNKAAQAVALFDVIHTIDREKIARHVKIECDKQAKTVPCLIQVNIGDEPQKAGIMPDGLPDFLSLCRDEIGLSVIGLMAIPPAEGNPAPHFAMLQRLAERHHLPELSIGMSGDWQTAIRFGASYIRLGTALFGARQS